MKKIIVLRVVIAIIIAYNIAAIAMSLYMLSQLPSVQLNSFMYNVMLYNGGLLLINEVTLLPGLIMLYQAIQYFIKSGYFNSKSASKFKTAGILLMISSFTGYILPNLFKEKYVLDIDAKNKYIILWFDSMPLFFILLLIGFGLYTLSDFIRRGEAIENENKLTI